MGRTWTLKLERSKTLVCVGISPSIDYFTHLSRSRAPPDGTRSRCKRASESSCSRPLSIGWRHACSSSTETFDKDPFLCIKTEGSVQLLLDNCRAGLLESEPTSVESGEGESMISRGDEEERLFVSVLLGIMG